MLAKPLLVLSSYSILFALLAIRVQLFGVKLALVAMTVIGVASLILFFRLDARATPAPHTIKQVDHPGPEAGAYLASYLLPFVISAKPEVWDVIAYGIFLLVAGIVTANTGAIQVNPLIYLMRRRIVLMPSLDDRAASLSSIGRCDRIMPVFGGDGSSRPNKRSIGPMLRF